MMKTSIAKRFIAAGAILFLFGLLTGFVIPAFTNPRMGLASHLEGVMNGTFLIALGAAWSYVNLSKHLALATYWLLLYGSFANWAVISMAAIFGSSSMTPIAGRGYSASALQEQIISLGLITVAVAMVLGISIVLYGIYNERAA